MIKRVVAQVAEWRRRLSPDFCVSVNVSPRQFRDPRLAEKVITAMKSVGLRGDGLEIEVTEGVLLPGRQEVDHALKALRRSGVGIVMDDFGTGYASLSYLRDHPFTSLKIDRSFVGNLDSDQLLPPTESDLQRYTKYLRVDEDMARRAGTLKGV